MEIVENHVGTILVLEPVGPLDRKTSPELQQKVVELIDQGNRHVVVDLVRTESIGGAGLRVLLMLSKKLESINGHMVLCSVTDETRNSFEVAGFGRMLAMTATRDEALRSLAGDETVARISDLALDLLGKSGDPPEPSRT
jgi:anti-anti-sigma factor